MNSRHDSNQQKFKDAGEQAARVVNEFVSIATDFSRQMEKEFCSRDAGQAEADHGDIDKSKGKSRAHRYSSGSGSANAVDSAGFESKSTGSYRSGAADSSAAESPSDGAGVEEPFIDDKKAEEEWRRAGEYLRELCEAAGFTIDGFAASINRAGAAETIRSVEGGRDVFPREWIHQVSALLKQNDPLEFVASLRSLYDQEYRAANDSADKNSEAGVKVLSENVVVQQRKQKLGDIFTDDQIESLSDEQFEELYNFVAMNYQSAISLIGNNK